MFAKSQDNSQNSPSPLSSAEAAASNTRRSVLHEGITIKGAWTSDGIVDFGGMFEGDLTVETLVLAKSGKIKGNVKARSVTIEGTLEGTISANLVALKTSAQVTADIVAHKLVIEPGALVEGYVACKVDPMQDQPSGSPLA